MVNVMLTMSVSGMPCMYKCINIIYNSDCTNDEKLRLQQKRVCGEANKERLRVWAKIQRFLLFSSFFGGEIHFFLLTL